jgi:hypothetical protein
MTNSNTARDIAVKIIEAELALAEVNALATDDFRAAFDAAVVEDLEARHQRAVRAVNAMHAGFAKAVKSSGGVVSPRTGGGK